MDTPLKRLIADRSAPLEERRAALLEFRRRRYAQNFPGNVCQHERREGFTECYGCHEARKEARRLIAEANARIMDASAILADTDQDASDRLAQTGSSLSGIRP